jgi:hypothetical protein
VKGLVGFGPSLIILPILSIVIGFKEAVAIGTLADIISGVIIIAFDHKNIRKKLILNTFIGMFVGTAIGVGILNTLNTDILKRIFGLLIILIVIWGYKTSTEKIKHTRFSKVKSAIVGFVAGLMGRILNTNGPILVLYYKKIFYSNKVLRTNLTAILLTDAIWRGLLLIQSGLINQNVIQLFVVGLLPYLVLGLYISSKVLNKVSSKKIKKMVEFILLVIGSGLLVR